MQDAARRIASLRADYLDRVGRRWQRYERVLAHLGFTPNATLGRRWQRYERVLALELVRALDEAAFALTLSHGGAGLARNDRARQLIVKGAATALLPLLETLRDDPDPVPWGPTNPELAFVADRHLFVCGQLNTVRRCCPARHFGADRRHNLLIALNSEELRSALNNTWRDIPGPMPKTGGFSLACCSRPRIPAHLTTREAIGDL